MHSNRPILLAAAMLLCLADRGQAQGAGGCSPTGSTPPHLSVRNAPAGRTLRLENGPALGRAFLLAKTREFPASGLARPASLGCLAAARGDMILFLQLDAMGTFEIPLPDRALAASPLLSVVAVPVGASIVDASLSNAISLGPLDGRTATPLSSAPGEVVISEFMKDPTTVSDGVGEWIEVYNPGSAPVDIEGWVLSDLGSDSAALLNGGAGIVVPANGFLVLGKSDDMAANGGVVVDFVLSGSTLSNGDDEIILSLPNGRLVDEVHYDGGTLWPDEPGRSASLELSAFDVTANDDPARWCNSSTPLSSTNTDTGTPGLANDPCTGG